MFNRLAMLLTPLLFLGLLAEKLTLLTPEDPGPYHDRVKAAIEAIPLRSGGWEGVDSKVPEPAQQLLKTPSILARHYTRVDGTAAGMLLFVHCRDSRDLAGHHPPVCYPTSGWKSEDAASVDLVVDGVSVPACRYEFSRRALGDGERQVVYAFFVLPSGRIDREMSAVRAAAADYRLRRFGAAEVQVVLAASLGSTLERATVTDLIRLLLPAVRVVADGHAEDIP